MKPWTVTASQPVLVDRWIHVRADDCLTAEGHEIKPFYILEYPDWVNVVALTVDGRVVLVRQYRHGLGSVTLGVPAGIVEDTDQDALAAGARELLEETGYRAARIELAATLTPNASTHANRLQVVVAYDVSPAAAPVEDPGEKIEVVVLPLAEAVAQAVSGGIMQAAQISALLLGLRHAGVLDIAPSSASSPSSGA